MTGQREIPIDPVLRHLTDSGLVGVVLLDRDFAVVNRFGRLVEWVEEAQRAPDVIPFLVGYEDVLTRLCQGEAESLFLPNISWCNAPLGKRCVFSVNAFAGPEGLGATLLFQDSTEIADLEQRVLQQRNMLALAQGELRRQTDRAQAANRAKSAFLANVSHELRTPLSVIIGNAEILGETAIATMDPGEVEGYLADIRDCGTFLLDLINDLLDLAKAEAGRLEISEAEVPVAEVVAECLKMTARLPFAEGLDFRSVFAAPSGALLADRRRVKQMLLNLLSNAARFTPAGGCITVATMTGEDGGLLLQVSDTGVGIAVEELQAIAEPFVQGSRGSAGNHPGTGLGLHMVETLMALHNGSLRIESAPDAGTTVSLCFPPNRLA